MMYLVRRSNSIRQLVRTAFDSFGRWLTLRMLMAVKLSTSGSSLMGALLAFFSTRARVADGTASSSSSSSYSPKAFPSGSYAWSSPATSESSSSSSSFFTGIADGRVGFHRSDSLALALLDGRSVDIVDAGTLGFSRNAS